MNRRRTLKPGDVDVNGYAIPAYIVHGGPDLARSKGLPLSECQFFGEDVEPQTAAHRRNRDAMWKRWVKAGALHVYADE